MNKEKFLNDLKKRISVLTDSEINDIINEYEDNIEEKIKHGKTEEEAVKEFGNIEELTKEILEAYKINPNYNNSDNLAKDCENLIKKGSKKLADSTEQIINKINSSDGNLNAQSIFEIIIKIFFALIALAILRIPFQMILYFGESIFDDFRILTILWRIIVEVSYFAILIIFIFYIVTKTFNKNNSNKVINKNDNKETSIKNDENVSNNENIQSRKSEVKYSQNNNTISSVIILLLKIFTCFVVVVPIFCMIFGFVVGLAACILLFIKGIYVIGFLLLLISGIIFLSALNSIILNALFGKKKFNFIPFLISIIIFVFGMVFSISYILGFTFYNKLPDRTEELVQNFTTTINKVSYIEYNDLVIDNTLKDGIINFEITYYSLDGSKQEFNLINNESSCTEDCYNNIFIDRYYETEKISFSDIYNSSFFDDLKNNELYNYSKIDDYTIKIYVNENTKDLVKN